MPTIDWRVEFFRHAFLRHAPQRYALMLAPGDAQRRGQKYMERRGAITDALIASHLNGTITLAAPAAIDNHAHLLPLDIDAGGVDALRALLAEIKRRELWAFGQYSLRHGLADEQQRGYVWLPFDAAVDAARLRALGAQLITAAGRPEWKVEARAFHAATRLPLARHQYTQRFGALVIGDQHIAIDHDPSGALATLYGVYRENCSTRLPELPVSPRQPITSAIPRKSQGITISWYNDSQDIEALIRHYGARPSLQRRLYFCPFHPDEHASLYVYTAKGRRYVHCLSTLSDCPLARHGQNDAFNVYCIGEGLDARAALRRLNRPE